jgi:hypothetical protein
MPLGEKAKEALKMKKRKDLSEMAANLRKTSLKDSETAAQKTDRLLRKQRMRGQEARRVGNLRRSIAKTAAKKPSLLGRLARVLSRLRLSVGVDPAVEATKKFSKALKFKRTARLDRES